MVFEGLTCSLSNQTLAQNLDSKKKNTKRNSYDWEALQKDASFVSMVSFFNHLFFFVKMGIPGMKVWV